MEAIETICEFQQKVKTYYLATVDNDQPHVRPFGTAHIFDGKLYIQTGKKKDVAHQLKANPKIEISGMTGGKWIRLQAEAVLDERLEAQQSMLDANPGLEKKYAAGDGNMEVYYLKNAKATIYSFNEEPVSYTF